MRMFHSACHFGRDLALPIVRIAVLIGIVCAPVGATAAQPVNEIVALPSVTSQTKTNDCWVAAAATLMAWKNGSPVPEDQVVNKLPVDLQALFVQDSVLGFAMVQPFASSLSLTAEGPQSFSIAGWAALIKAHGPLWVGAANTGFSNGHVWVVHGIAGDGTPTGTTFSIVDVGTGQANNMTVAKFIELYEKAARDQGAVGDIYPQVLHF